MIRRILDTVGEPLSVTARCCAAHVFFSVVAGRPSAAHPATTEQYFIATEIQLSRIIATSKWPLLTATGCCRWLGLLEDSSGHEKVPFILSMPTYMLGVSLVIVNVH